MQHRSLSQIRVCWNGETYQFEGEGEQYAAVGEVPADLLDALGAVPGIAFEG